QVVGPRIGWIDVGVLAVVAGRSYEHLANPAAEVDGAGGLDGVEERGGAAAAPTVVGDAGAVLDRIGDGRRGPDVGASAVGVEELQRHQRRFPVNAGYADAVVADGRDGARDVGAVAVVVKGVVGVVDEVPADEVVGMGRVAVLSVAGKGPAALPRVVAVGVQDHRGQNVGRIDAAIAIYVRDFARPLINGIIEVPKTDDAVAVHVLEVLEPALGDLGLVDPDVLEQVRVVIVDARVDDGDDRGGAAGGDFQGLRRANAVGAVAAPEGA